MPDVSICIVNYKSKEVLKQCLYSIVHSRETVALQVIVVDNHSDDGTDEMMKELFPFIKFITCAENIGFARANNVAAQQAQGRYFFFLNPDTLIHSGMLSRMVSFMDRYPHAALLGPRLVYSDGSIQSSVRRFPTFFSALHEYTVLGKIPLFTFAKKRFRYTDFQYNQLAEVDQLMGAALLIRSEVFYELNGFDEHFFMFYEEVDLCRRVKMRGLKVYYYPDAYVTHIGGVSRRQMSSLVYIASLRSLFLYFRKHEKKYQLILLDIYSKCC